MRCLTLYAGAGGADLGLLAAGVEHVACVDANADCVATLRAAGFPGIHAGIGVPYEGAPAFDPSPFTGADLVWASPPCQPYSHAGKGLGADDARDGWPHTLAILATLRPRWAVVENVRGAPVETWAGELARRFVALPEWRWAPGMLTTQGERVVSVDADGTLRLAAMGVDSVGGEFVRVFSDGSGGCLPDLTDPATQGCIVAWAREVLGATAYTYPLASGWNVVRGGLAMGWGATEMEAWCWALEAAAR